MPHRRNKLISLTLCLLLLLEQTGFAQAVSLNLSKYLSHAPKPAVSDTFRPLHLRYLSYDNSSNNFQLLLDKGSSPPDSKPALEQVTQELLKYFFIGLALPNDKFWVNLRPDSPDDILDPDLEKTDIGRIFLEADVQLKQDTSGLTSPQTKEGREYWDKLYKKAGEFFGTENITIPTLTRPWIVPDEVIIRESPEGAYIYKATLKVMLEEDYLTSRGGSRTAPTTYQQYIFNDPRLKELNEYSTQLIKETIIPKLTSQINTSKRYAPLRQVYYSLILAQWFKQSHQVKRSQSHQLPENPHIKLIDSGKLITPNFSLLAQQPYDKQAYFKQYQQSFKDGEYNLQEQIHTPMGQSIRRYMSGGMMFGKEVSSAIESGKIAATIKHFFGKAFLPFFMAATVSLNAAFGDIRLHYNGELGENTASVSAGSNGINESKDGGAKASLNINIHSKVDEEVPVNDEEEMKNAVMGVISKISNSTESNDAQGIINDLETLRKKGGEQFITDQLVQIISNKDGGTNKITTIMDIAGALGLNGAMPVLVGKLYDSDPLIRMMAANSIGMIGPPGNKYLADKLVEELKRLKRGESDDPASVAMSMAINGIQTEQVIEDIVTQLIVYKNLNDVPSGLFWKLSSVVNYKAAPILIKLLTHDNKIVRYHAISVIYKIAVRKDLVDKELILDYKNKLLAIATDSNEDSAIRAEAVSALISLFKDEKWLPREVEDAIFSALMQADKTIFRGAIQGLTYASFDINGFMRLIINSLGENKGRSSENYIVDLLRQRPYDIDDKFKEELLRTYWEKIDNNAKLLSIFAKLAVSISDVSVKVLFIPKIIEKAIGFIDGKDNEINDRRLIIRILPDLLDSVEDFNFQLKNHLSDKIIKDLSGLLSGDNSRMVKGEAAMSLGSLAKYQWLLKEVIDNFIKLLRVEKDGFIREIVGREMVTIGYAYDLKDLDHFTRNIVYRSLEIANGLFSLEDLDMIYGDKSFKENTKDIGPVNQFHIARDIIRYMERSGKPKTPKNITECLELILEARNEFSYKTIMSEKSSLYVLTHSSDEALFDHQNIVKLAKAYGVKDIPAILNGSESKESFLDTIETIPFNPNNNVVYATLHGMPEYIILQRADFREEEENNKIWYNEMAKALISRAQHLDGENKGKLSDMILIINACYSANWVLNLENELNYAMKDGKIVDMPIIVSSTDLDVYGVDDMAIWLRWMVRNDKSAISGLYGMPGHDLKNKIHNVIRDNPDVNFVSADYKEFTGRTILMLRELIAPYNSPLILVPMEESGILNGNLMAPSNGGYGLKFNEEEGEMLKMRYKNTPLQRVGPKGTLRGRMLEVKVSIPDAVVGGKENLVVSSAVQQNDKKGGIDLSRINKSMRAESVSSPGVDGLNNLVDVDFDLNEELIQLQKLLNAEIVPSADRLNRYARAACSSSLSSPDSKDSALSLVAETFRLQEEKAVPDRVGDDRDRPLQELAAWLEQET